MSLLMFVRVHVFMRRRANYAMFWRATQSQFYKSEATRSLPLNFSTTNFSMVNEAVRKFIFKVQFLECWKTVSSQLFFLHCSETSQRHLGDVHLLAKQIGCSGLTVPRRTAWLSNKAASPGAHGGEATANSTPRFWVVAREKNPGTSPNTGHTREETRARIFSKKAPIPREASRVPPPPSCVIVRLVGRTVALLCSFGATAASSFVSTSAHVLEPGTVIFPCHMKKKKNANPEE